VSTPQVTYRGRFAPSPTGPLHFGSLVAALGSYLRARSSGGHWYVRIEDIDPPREVPGAASDILNTLAAFGLEWDGEVTYQSRRTDRYAAALETLIAQGAAYPCSCTRNEIRAYNRARIGSASTVYPGLCRDRPLRSDRRPAFRLRVPDSRLEVQDLEVGVYAMNLAQQCGDFALKRRDGLFAYQLAVVVDDAAQGITEVVRGQDLLDSTPGQIFLQRTLGFPNPAYMHLPVVTNSEGQKLSKQTGAQALSLDSAAHTLCEALAFLGLTPPNEMRHAAAKDVVAWGITHWASRRSPATAHPGQAKMQGFSQDQ
jgi:glutamyl-Q tRNA(Asp) synthetase